jgi:uncharacterized membrane protein YdfJ with MMPL/SSD domain
VPLFLFSVESAWTRLITGAALITIAVIWGFAMGDLITPAIGFGVAVALLFDPTIVRAVLVSAGMKLLGKWNWSLPVGCRGCRTRTSRAASGPRLSRPRPKAHRKDGAVGCTLLPNRKRERPSGASPRV